MMRDATLHPDAGGGDQQAAPPVGSEKSRVMRDMTPLPRGGAALEGARRRAAGGDRAGGGEDEMGGVRDGPPPSQATDQQNE